MRFPRLGSAPFGFGGPGAPPGFGAPVPSGPNPADRPPPIHPFGTANRDFPLAPREPAEDRRVRRSLELLTSTFNSLGLRGQLIQLPLGQWRITGGVYSESRNPTANDDVTRGVVIGDEWLNLATDTLWKCFSAAAGVARWKQLQTV